MAIGQIPPWLNIDPLAPVANYLQGYRTGVSERESETAANLRAQQMFLAAQEAAQMAQLRQQQQELDAAQFNARLRLDEQKAEREAKAAAQQMEGQLGIQADLAAGVAWPQALAKWAPKLFAGEPAALARSMGDIVPPQPPTFGTTPEGARYMQSPTGGTTLVPPSYSRGPFEPRVIEKGGRTLYERSPDVFVPLTKEEQYGALNQVQRAELQTLNRREANLYRQLGELTEEEASKDPTLSKVLDQIAEIEAERQAIFSGAERPKAEAQPLPAKKEDLVKGRVYQTARGPATWDGEKFVQ